MSLLREGHSRYEANMDHHSENAQLVGGYDLVALGYVLEDLLVFSAGFDIASQIC